MLNLAPALCHIRYTLHLFLLWHVEPRVRMAEIEIEGISQTHALLPIKQEHERFRRVFLGVGPQQQQGHPLPRDSPGASERISTG